MFKTIKYKQNALVNYEVHKGFLESYEISVEEFFTDILEIGYDTDSPEFASILLNLKQRTVLTYIELKKFKEKISTNLLDLYPWEMRRWQKKFFQLICMQLQGTLYLNACHLRRKHHDWFNFTYRDVCNNATEFMNNPNKVIQGETLSMNICELLVLNKRFYNLLRSCVRLMEQHTEDDDFRYFNQKWEKYKKKKGVTQINLFKRNCERLTENGKMTKTQYNQLYDSIFKEIDDDELKMVVEGCIGNPAGLIEELQERNFRERILDQVFCAYSKLEVLDRIYEQREEQAQLNYSQKLNAFLTECVKDIQAASYSKDGESLIRSSNEWFYVYRIFDEKGVKGLTQRKEFVEKLQDVPIKVTKLPTDPSSLNKIGQEFKERAYPNWAVPDGRASFKHERHLEIGGATLKAYEKHKGMLV